MRDTGRSDAYAAEDLAFDGTALERVPGADALAAAARAVLASPWWSINVGDAGLVRRVRVRTAGDSHWAPRTRTVALDPRAPWYVLTHELAHVAADASGRDLATDAAHGPGWRGWNVALVAAAFGDPFAALLRAGWRRHGLAVSDPGAGPPPSPIVDLGVPTARREGWRGGH